MIKTVDILYKTPKNRTFRITDVEYCEPEGTGLVVRTIWGHTIEIPLKKIKDWKIH